MSDIPVIQLLLTGNEVMSGDTVDSNSAMMAQRLAELGLAVYRKVTVGDDLDLLAEELRSMSRSSQVLIVNGGLGPTADDLTAQVLAGVAELDLVEQPEAVAHLETWCAARGANLNAANLKQAFLPEGCEIVPNPIGSAVGFQLELNGCLVICTPGVPSELRLMMDRVLETLKARLKNTRTTDVLRLQCFGMGESALQQLIDDHVEDWPAGVELGFRAGAPQVEVKLTIRDAALKPSQLLARDKIYAVFGDHIVGEGDTRMAEAVLSLLDKRGQTLTTAESCTGGLIASMLTEIPGSSRGFHAGFVSYDNRIKHSVLGVSEHTLQAYGAVSEEVVIQMAEGAIERSGADYAIAVSGIAGPDGGSEDKPVGTVWLAWGSSGALQTRCLRYQTNRKLFQTLVAAVGLDLIRRQLLNLDQTPRYFIERRAN